jgi:hypothetical protein
LAEGARAGYAAGLGAGVELVGTTAELLTGTGVEDVGPGIYAEELVGRTVEL